MKASTEYHRDPSERKHGAFRKIDAEAELALRSGRRRYSKLNNAMGWLLAALVIFSAVPAASNRPVFWMGWTAVLMLLAVFYLILGARLAPGRPLRLWDQVPLMLIMAVIPLWALVQAAPGIGQWANELPVPQDLQPATISLAPQASLLAALRITSYLVFFSLVLEVSSRADRAQRLAWAVFLGVALHALYGLASLHFLGDQFFWGEKTAYRGFATGTFINRNAFASFIGMGMCLGLGLTLQNAEVGKGIGRRRQGRWVPNAGTLGMGVALTLMGITLIMTGSRMGTMASGIALCVVYGAMQLKNGMRLRQITMRLAAVLAVAFVAIIPIYGLDFVWRMIFSVTDAAYRTTIYTTVLQMITERPVLGYGLDAFEPAYEIYRGPDAVAQLITEYAHSSYLGNWLELGLLVGSLPLFAVAFAAVRLVRIVVQNTTNVALPVVALGALCLLAFHATVDFSFEMQANIFLLLFLLALGLAPRRTASIAQA